MKVKNLIKYANFIIFVLFYFVFCALNFTLLAAATPNIDPQCKDPTSPIFDTPECARARLGINNIDFGFAGGYDIDSNISLILTIILVVTIFVSFIFLGVGILKFGSSGDNPDKRTKAIYQMIYSVVAILLAGIAIPFVSGLFFNFTGREVPTTIIDCDKLPKDASKDLIDRCKKIKGNIRRDSGGD